MDKSHFSVTWDKYYTSMCAGFSKLQQNGELVDLTLAADGRLVKVHQVVVGIASPYLKDLIQSADCKHPVIFLNNVTYTTLCSILEYIYTGEVSVKEEHLSSFFETAKTLDIQGLGETVSISSDKIADQDETVSNLTDSPLKIVNMKLKTVEVPSSKGKTILENVQLPPAARNIQLKRKIMLRNLGSEPKKKFEFSPSLPAGGYDPESDHSVDEADMSAPADTSPDDFQLSGLVEQSSADPVLTDNTQSTVPPAELQYTVSNRGALQLILNRYMYNLYSRSFGGRVRRWRCVDYRDRRCPAAAITDNNVVVKRTNLHNHQFHDGKILSKIKNKAVFSAINSVETNATSD